MAKKRVRRHSDEFKRMCVERMKQCNDIGALANELDRPMKGAKLGQRRLALGLTQQGLASKLKVSRNTMGGGEMAIPGFLHFALKTLECQAAKASKSSSKR